MISFPRLKEAEELLIFSSLHHPGDSGFSGVSLLLNKLCGCVHAFSSLRWSCTLPNPNPNPKCSMAINDEGIISTKILFTQVPTFCMNNLDRTHFKLNILSATHPYAAFTFSLNLSSIFGFHIVEKL